MFMLGVEVEVKEIVVPPGLIEGLVEEDQEEQQVVL